MEDRRLERLTRICLELPEAERTISGRHARFAVRDRTFAYYLVDHRGDEGITGVVCKAPRGRNEQLAAAQPDRYYMPAYMHHKGWLGLRLDTPKVGWDEVGGVVLESYLLIAPKRLAAQVMPPD